MPALAKVLDKIDANLDQAAAAIGASAFGCAGERCMAGSIAVPVGGVAEPLVDRIVKLGENMKTGPTDTGDAVDMGPLITRQHQQRVAGYLDIASADGASVALDGRKVVVMTIPGGADLWMPEPVDKRHDTVFLRRVVGRSAMARLSE